MKLIFATTIIFYDTVLLLYCLFAILIKYNIYYFWGYKHEFWVLSSKDNLPLGLG